VGGHLRIAQQKISDCVMAAINRKENDEDKWPFLSVRRMMEEPILAKRTA
jgi:hypothetical protein